MLTKRSSLKGSLEVAVLALDGRSLLEDNGILLVEQGGMLIGVISQHC